MPIKGRVNVYRRRSMRYQNREHPRNGDVKGLRVSVHHPFLETITAPINMMMIATINNRGITLIIV